MSSKIEIAHTLGILLDITKWESLKKLPEDVLYEMYRGYIQNAKSYNHLRDEVTQLKTKVLCLKGNQCTCSDAAR